MAAVVTLNDGGNIGSARVAVTGAGPKAIRLSSVESALAGQPVGGIAAACASAADGLDITGDIHASAEYRAHLVRVFAQRALESAASRAK